MDSLKVDSHGQGLDGPAERLGPNSRPSESANLGAIREAFRAFSEDGVTAGVDALLSHAHEDCEFRPYTAGEKVLKGRDEARAFFSEAVAAGAAITVRTQTFEERGDEIVVSGSVRLQRPAGGFAESQIRWIYRFREGLIEDAQWGPRHPD